MSIKWILLYLLVINIAGFIAMGIDKHKAKMADRRIPENTLFGFCFLGGGIGTISGIYAFRHKTKKKLFTIGMPLVVVLQILIIIYFRFMA